MAHDNFSCSAPENLFLYIYINIVRALLFTLQLPLACLPRWLLLFLPLSLYIFFVFTSHPNWTTPWSLDLL